VGCGWVLKKGDICKPYDLTHKTKQRKMGPDDRKT
jgi:hypothetical protein